MAGGRRDGSRCRWCGGTRRREFHGADGCPSCQVGAQTFHQVSRRWIGVQHHRRYRHRIAAPLGGVQHEVEAQSLHTETAAQHLRHRARFAGPGNRQAIPVQHHTGARVDAVERGEVAEAGRGSRRRLQRFRSQVSHPRRRDRERTRRTRIATTDRRRRPLVEVRFDPVQRQLLPRRHRDEQRAERDHDARRAPVRRAQ